MNERLVEGWWWALNARRAHFYRQGEIRSLCGKQMTFGTRPGTENTNHESPDNCAECKRRRAPKPKTTRAPTRRRIETVPTGDHL